MYDYVLLPFSRHGGDELRETVAGFGLDFARFTRHIELNI